MESKTGIELIAQERKEQKEKHQQYIEDDVKYNPDYQLCHAASRLLFSPIDECQELMLEDAFRPKDWNRERWGKMQGKTYKERLIIAGALIAAEIDRLNYLENGH